MNNKITRSTGNIDRECGSKPVSVRGGMRLVKEMLDRAGIREILMELPLNVYNFFRETLRIIDIDKSSLIRADSGFFAGKFMKYLESLCLNYIISAKTNHYLKNEIYRITNRLQADGGIYISGQSYRL